MSLYDIRAAYEALRPALLDDLRRADGHFMGVVERALGYDPDDDTDRSERDEARRECFHMVDIEVHPSSGNVFADTGTLATEARLAWYDHERRERALMRAREQRR
jgi:hypothetical protein